MPAVRLRKITKELSADQGPSFADDTWPARMLGLPEEDHNRHFNLVFSGFHQEWLKESCKQFVRYSAGSKRFKTLHAFISAIRRFSGFLHANRPGATSEVLSRQLMIEYVFHLNESGLSAATRLQRLSLLRTFLETANMNNWLSCPPFIIRSEDFPKVDKRPPRFIPEEVLQQLNRHLHHLPPPVMRMVLVLQETGLRIGELVTLSLSCIEQDARGDWFIRFNNRKMYKEQINPISRELAKVIQEQQEYIREHLPADFSYLFCGSDRGWLGPRTDALIDYSPVENLMCPAAFNTRLQRLAEVFEIRGSDGNIWRFQAHQFRHTVGTRMINSGVSLHIIQRYLGHESPEMTLRYAHIHDKTMKDELAQYLNSKVVDVNGEIVEQLSLGIEGSNDLEWMKRNVLAQTLPNGSCARPVLKGPCPHANACLTCADFRTTVEHLPQHKAQLERTDELVALAEEKGLERQADMNRQVRRNLFKIIATLEKQDECKHEGCSNR